MITGNDRTECSMLADPISWFQKHRPTPPTVWVIGKPGAGRAAMLGHGRDSDGAGA